MAFGSVSADNFTHLSDIASVVKHSVGVSVREEGKGVREKEKNEPMKESIQKKSVERK